LKRVSITISSVWMSLTAAPTNCLLPGIDVQAELRAKTGSPNLGPTHMPQNLVQPPPIQRAIMNRHHQSRRSNSSIAPKHEPINQSPIAPSPKSRPTPSSHSNSPTNTASGFSPAPSDSMSMRGGVAGITRQQMQQPMPPTSQALRPQNVQHAPVQRHQPQTSGASFYPTPAFQNHIEQLEQEYDAQAEMIDDPELETPIGGPGPYPTAYQHDNPHMLSPASNGTGPPLSHHQEPPHQMQTTGQQYPSMTQLLDQNLDWDPFGLSASMAFPSQPYQVDQTNMR
jgi:hypothetical protein